jgi:hypothetical protein
MLAWLACIDIKLVTSDINSYQFSHRGKIITLVDTPGFDDSNISDSEILMKLLGWLKETQEDEQKLSGILYLHRIDAPRMQGSALRNFGTFKQLCGEEFYKNIMLGTTCWDLVDATTIGKERETQLRERERRILACAVAKRFRDRPNSQRAGLSSRSNLPPGVERACLPQLTTRDEHNGPFSG